VIGLAALVAVNATRGGKNPLLVALTSNFAEASGVLVPIPVCAFAMTVKKIKLTPINILIIYFIYYLFMAQVIM
jgi:hypothetical protein